jgi:hypothetical protein
MIVVEDCLDCTELIRREFDLERAHIRLHFGWRSGTYKRDAEHGVRQHPCQGVVIKLALVSLDATIRSKVTVGMPFDIAIYPRDSLVAPLRQEVTMESAYYLSVQAQWQAGLCQTFEHLPSLTWPRPI